MPLGHSPHILPHKTILIIAGRWQGLREEVACRASVWLRNTGWGGLSRRWAGTGAHTPVAGLAGPLAVKRHIQAGKAASSTSVGLGPAATWIAKVKHRRDFGGAANSTDWPDKLTAPPVFQLTA